MLVKLFLSNLTDTVLNTTSFQNKSSQIDLTLNLTASILATLQSTKSLPVVSKRTQQTKKLSNELFPDFNDYNYDFGKSSSNLGAVKNSKVNELNNSFFLDLLPTEDYDSSRLDINKTAVIIPSEEYFMNDYSSSSNLTALGSASIGDFYGQLLTPFLYILFIFLVYFLIISIIFMSAVYSHRKRVGYNYEDVEGDEANESAYGKEGNSHRREILKTAEQNELNEEEEERRENKLVRIDIANEFSEESDENKGSAYSQTSKNKEFAKSIRDDRICSDETGSDSDYSNVSDERSCLKQKSNKENVTFIENVFKLLVDTEPIKSTGSVARVKWFGSGLRPKLLLSSKRAEKKKNAMRNIYRENDESEAMMSSFTTQGNVFSIDKNFTTTGLKPLLNGSFFEEEKL